MARRDLVGVAALVALVWASALLLQPFGFNQGAHYALVKALADGTASIDRFATFSGDISSYHGHLYSNKAPGLAFATLPAYLVLHGLGLPSGVHALSLWSVLLPALGLLLLVRSQAERIEPGLGTVSALTLGAGTLVLPFTGLFFAHALSALLGFAAFVLLWREREGEQRLWMVAAAGLIAGLAVTTEYPLALPALILAGYAAVRSRPPRRLLSYGAGLAVGVAPLAGYQWWAFGSPFRTTYAGQLVHAGTTGAGIPKDTRPPGLDGRAHVALELLLSYRGLLTLAPVVAVAAAGVLLLYRRGNRAEAVVIASVAILLLGANSGFWGPFGGWGPGPRYLITALPFLALGLAPAFRVRPVTTAALALASAAVMIVATATEPLLPNNRGHVGQEGDVVDTALWVDRLRAGDFTRTVFSSAGAGHGWVAIAPFFVLVALALALTAMATTCPRLRRRDVAGAVTALAAWALCAHFLPSLLHEDYGANGGIGESGAIISVLAAACAVIAALSIGRPFRPIVERRTVWSSSGRLLGRRGRGPREL